MADGKVQDCRNGCGRKIFVSDRSGRWLPYDMGTDNKHDCPNFQQKQSSKFADNKARYGQAYQGPSQNDQMQKDLADLVVWKDATEMRIKELEQEANRFIELTDAIAKELKIKSFKKASELQDTPVTDDEEDVVE